MIYYLDGNPWICLAGMSGRVQRVHLRQLGKVLRGGHRLPGARPTGSPCRQVQQGTPLLLGTVSGTIFLVVYLRYFMSR